jgi:antiviral helicase SLH1
VYGLTVQDVENDPSLGQERHKLMVHTAVTLSRYEMVSFDQDTASLSSTELGTIAAKFFLRAQTIEIFNELFKPKMTEADVLATLSKSKEFEQIAVRDEENTELEALLKKIPCQVQVRLAAVH